MAAVSRSSSGTHALPEEVISFRNIQATFPGIFEDGLKLLAEVAGKIQVMRLETELFPTLRVETNKETLKSHERAYKEIQGNRRRRKGFMAAKEDFGSCVS